MELNAVLAIFTLISGDTFDHKWYVIIANLLTISCRVSSSYSRLYHQLLYAELNEHSWHDVSLFVAWRWGGHKGATQVCPFDIDATA